jgi:hypothetical protein
LVDRPARNTASKPKRNDSQPAATGNSPVRRRLPRARCPPLQPTTAVLRRGVLLHRGFERMAVLLKLALFSVELARIEGQECLLARCAVNPLTEWR